MFKRALLLAVVLPLQVPAVALAADEQAPRIQVTGSGTATVAPDMALLSLTVTREAATAREALDANNQAMAAVIAEMRDAGIAERDLQTSGFSITPRYVYPKQDNDRPEPPRIVGYEVSNSLALRIRDLARLGPLLDRSVSLGVNQGGNVTFTNDDPSAALTKARKDAVAEALAKAATLAEAAHVGVGRILEITETTSAPGPEPMLRKMAMEASAVPVATGENSYTVTVSVTFAIEQ